MLETDRAWFQDARVLFRRPAEFWPARDQGPEERLNALVRLVLYASAATALYSRKPKFMVFGIVAVVVVSLAYGGCSPGPSARSGTARGVASDVVAHRGASACQRPGAAGRGRSQGTTGHQPSAGGPSCTLSTADNPFANMLLSDLATNPGRAAACKYDDHKDLIEENFNKGLVRDVFDVWDRQNNRRQFMTMPVTTASPDTMAFAQFCYGNAGRLPCKEDASRCTGFKG